MKRRRAHGRSDRERRTGCHYRRRSRYSLTGSGGADVLDGGGGDDSINATVQDAQAYDRTDGTHTVKCGAGNDDVIADENDNAGVDCERIRVGLAGGPPLTLDMGAARADRKGSMKLTFRVEFPNPDNALASRSSFRLVDRKGRAASSTRQLVLGGEVHVAVCGLSSAARRNAVSGAADPARCC